MTITRTVVSINGTALAALLADLKPGMALHVCAIPAGATLLRHGIAPNGDWELEYEHETDDGMPITITTGEANAEEGQEDIHRASCAPLRFDQGQGRQGDDSVSDEGRG